jgi:hypothetical protein
MNRSLSYAHAYVVATDCVFTLQMALDGPEPLDFYRNTLRKKVAALKAISRLFLQMGWSAIYPDLYAPVADAHISLREALRSHFIDRDGLLCACAYLERILLIDPRKGGKKHVA